MNPSKITLRVAELQAEILPPPSSKTSTTDREPPPEIQRILKLARAQALARQASMR